MKEGALDFLAKPVDPDHLLLLVERALAQRRMVAENRLLQGGAGRAAGRADDHRPRPVARACDGDVHRAAATDTTGAARRRERHGQGAGRARAARAQRPRRRALRRDQLRRDSGDAARNRAVRPREGRVHRRERAQAGPLRAGASRHALPRRDRRPAARRSRRRFCARSRRSNSSGSAARSPCRSTFGSSRRRIATSRRRSPRGSFARISISACRSSRSTFRRCANVPATSRCWRGISSIGSAAT